MHRPAFRVLTMLVVVAAATRSAAADPIFNVTDLGAIIATGLNNGGQVIGEGAIAPSAHRHRLQEGAFFMTDTARARGPRTYSVSSTCRVPSTTPA